MIARPMFSLYRLMPGPLVAVITLEPAIAAPMHMPMADISSSAWIATPPTFGSSLTIESRICVAGVMGYPAKKSQPALSSPALSLHFH
jgi:hypothetical protein